VSDDANLTPEQEADVRRLLAEARHDDPLPPDVATRLDRVLAQLAAGDPDLDPAQVVELASRRRHRAASLLVAAAAIVAVGVGIGQVLPTGGSDSGSADSADAAAKDFAGTESSADQLLLARRAPRAHSGPTEVRSGHFTTDVVRAGQFSGVRLRSLSFDSAYAAEAPVPEAAGADREDDTTADSSDGVNVESNSVLGGLSAKSTYECAPGPYGAGRLVAVLYDGEPAVLAFRRPMGDSRIVDLMQCDTGNVLRSVTLPRG
jgi:hypothetical protein